ncbi:hypothetical protein K8089_01000 [Aequorivita sp. F47161]|uniref:Uncharacterized protein n=1 Tax=Aequorivita vitellina TaxID=2874475 RepID=A0A9X1QRT2_9FLAO|nr:hypothetical protein [Aequorivita vitellina]MCG2417580.1 hypothetical protein [Aequorivita vitellina]
MTAKEFWMEFENYEETLRFNMDLTEMERDDISHYYLLLLLSYYHPGLELFLGYDKNSDTEKYKLIISCGGKRDLFMYVNTLVEAAPALSQWEIIAFKQAQFKVDAELLTHPFDFPDYSIRPKDIRFAVTEWYPEEGVFDLLLLLPLNLKKFSQDWLENSVSIIFQELWGERFVGEKINALFFTYHSSSEYDFLELHLLETCLNSFE